MDEYEFIGGAISGIYRLVKVDGKVGCERGTGANQMVPSASPPNPTFQNYCQCVREGTKVATEADWSVSWMMIMGAGGVGSSSLTLWMGYPTLLGFFAVVRGGPVKVHVYLHVILQTVGF